MRRHGCWVRVFIRPFLAQHKAISGLFRAHHAVWVDDPSTATRCLTVIYVPKYYPRFVSGGQAMFTGCSDPWTIYRPSGAADALWGSG